MRILVVEDEEAIAEGLRFNFEQEGYDVTLAGDGPAALRVLERQDPPIDLIVLDLMLPGMSGYDVCTQIRALDKLVPILMLTARSLSEDRARGFDVGTDQYLTKPFALPELISRVRNLLARRQQIAETLTGTPRTGSSAGTEPYRFNGVEVDFQTFTVTVHDKKYTLTTLEMQLLRYFIEHEGRVLSRQQILQRVWDQSADVTTRTIDNFVLRLRKLIEPDPANPRFILSVRGTGYRFVSQPDSAEE
jgi:DNA-binding response OmpR family regulator